MADEVFAGGNSSYKIYQSTKSSENLEIVPTQYCQVFSKSLESLNKN